MILYKTTGGAIVGDEGRLYRLPEIDWDQLVNHDSVLSAVLATKNSWRACDDDFALGVELLPPIGSQEDRAVLGGIVLKGQPVDVPPL